MKTTARVQTAEALSVPSAVASDRLAAPDFLSDAASDEWTLIVNSLPPGYFKPADVALLGAFCSASALYKKALQLIEEDGITLENDKGRQYAHPANTILTAQGSMMAQMAVKLRMCPSSRMASTEAGKKARDTLDGKKPWQTDEDEDEPSAQPTARAKKSAPKPWDGMNA